MKQIVTKLKCCGIECSHFNNSGAYHVCVREMRVIENKDVFVGKGSARRRIFPHWCPLEEAEEEVK